MKEDKTNFMHEIEGLIKLNGLIPHPEGGYFKETYRSEYSTGIFYLLVKGQKSSFHRIKSDEMWHFYGGDSISVVEITPEGKIKETFLDKNNPQYVVPANVWFGAYLPEGSEYAFTGCTVSPAFNFQDFELGNKNKLLIDFPMAKEMIEKLLD
jgi:predicted cupin superfamily sugar epimerase